MRICKTVIAGLAAATLFAGVQGAAAQKTTIRAVSCFPVGHTLSLDFEAFIAEVNAKAQGWSIRYLGGAPAVGSPFTLVQNMAKGVYDMSFCPNSYYQNVLPEADALKLIEKSPEEFRKNGGFEYVGKLHEEKGMKLLARFNHGLRMHLYLGRDKALTAPDLSGLQIRAAPIYAPFFQALGANTVQTDLTQVFTYMENRTVDGYGWTATAMLPDWYRVTGYRVDPGFYDAGIELLMSLQGWRELSDAQRKELTEVALKYETTTEANVKTTTEAARALQAEKGMKTISFTGAQGDKWLGKAREVGWESVIKASPTHGPAMKKLLAND